MNRTPTVSTERSRIEALCHDLGDALHAASQPLTILRASLGATELPRSSEDDLRKLLRRSAKEVERLCLFLNYLQQFIAVEGDEANCGREDLSQLVRHTLEGVDLLFAEAGIVLELQTTDPVHAPVLIDSSRLEHVLSSSLLVILARLSRGDRVDVRVHRTDVSIETSTQTTDSDALVISAEARLSLALAAANLRSMGGGMTWRKNPFSVHITLPAQDIPV